MSVTGAIVQVLPVGSLVRWSSAPGSPLGVVQDVDGPRLSVRFDGEDEPKVFNARSGALERVEFAGMVRRHSTGSIGMLQSLTTTTPPRWQVVLDGRVVTVA